MDAELKRIRERLESTPPACIKGFLLAPAELPVYWDDNPKSVWGLACICGQKKGSVLGYPLVEYNPNYDGPEIFISPLGFTCSSCENITEIIDTDHHGYHAEVGKLEGSIGSAKYRGKGQRKRFPCPGCRSDQFTITVGFVYWPVAFDLFFDEPTLPFQDFFNIFLCYGQCADCGVVTTLTDFGKV